MFQPTKKIRGVPSMSKIDSYDERGPAATRWLVVGAEHVARQAPGRQQWTELAPEPAGVGTLMRATGGRPASSDRYRDILATLGLQDELRAAMRIRDICLPS